MKNLLFLSLGIAAVFTACNSKPANSYTVTGNVDGLDGKNVYLAYNINDSVVIDTATVENGTFTFSGTIDSPVQASVIYGTPGDYRGGTAGQFYIEPGDITLSGLTASDFTRVISSGTVTNEELAEYMTNAFQLVDAYREIEQEARNTQDTAELKNLQEKALDIRGKMDVLDINFIKTHPASYHTPQALRMAAGKMSYEELKEAYESLTPEIQAKCSQTKAELDAVAAIQPGMPAPELTGVNHKGEAEKLSDLKGKVVLLDFWATWCGPCRASFPHVQELYKKYNGKGFEVFCIGDDDNNVEGWKQYIESDKDGVGSYHHILRGRKVDASSSEGEDQSAKYAIHFLPTKFLVDRDGKIIGKFDDAQLDEKLKEIFGE